MNNATPFFVFGPQKCGSSLTTALLSQHPQVRIATDTVFLNVFMSFLRTRLTYSAFCSGDTCLAHPFGEGALRTDLFQMSATETEVKWYLSRLLDRYFTVTTDRLDKLARMQGTNADIDFLKSEELLPFEHGRQLDLVPLLTMARKGCHWSDLFNAIIRQLAGAQGNGQVLVGEKTPGHMRFIPLMASGYPDAKFIFIIRNPIANVASYFKRDNAGLSLRGKGDLNHAVSIYKGFIDPFLPFYQAHRDRFLVIRYEDVVYDPETTMKSVLGYLGLPPHKLDTHHIKSPKGIYVGNNIDRNREKSAYTVLNKPRSELVVQSLAPVFMEFYPEIVPKYSHVLPVMQTA